MMACISTLNNPLIFHISNCSKTVPKQSVIQQFLKVKVDKILEIRYNTDRKELDMIDRLDEINLFKNDDEETQLCFLTWDSTWTKFKKHMKQDPKISEKYQRALRFLKMYAGDISFSSLKEALNLSFVTDFGAQVPGLKKHVKHWHLEARILHGIFQKEQKVLTEGTADHAFFNSLKPISIARIFSNSIELNRKTVDNLKNIKLNTEDWPIKAEKMLKKSLQAHFPLPENSRKKEEGRPRLSWWSRLRQK